MERAGFFKMDLHDLKTWPILEELNDIKDILKIYVFEKLAIMLKHNGKIFVKGKGKCTSSSCSTLSRFIEISLQNVIFIDFTTDGCSCLALTKEGHLYKNIQYNCLHSLSLMTSAQHFSVSKMACATNYYVYLTSTGSLRECGPHGDKSITLSSNSTPNQTEEIDCIMCTKYYPIAIAKSGKLFIPQLPRNSNTNNYYGNQSVTLREFGNTLKNKKVIQVVEGLHFVFALTENGEIYKWPLSSEILKEPEQLLTTIGRIVKLWASISSNTLAANDENGICCFLDCNGIPSTIQLWKDNFPITYFAERNENVYGPIYDQTYINYIAEETGRISEQWKTRFESCFNEEENSDITFNIGNQVIYAHRAIVSAQCSYLRSMLSSNWSKNPENRIITIQNYTYPTYLKFLKYLYTGKLEISAQEDNLELLQLSHEYDEKNLLIFCEKWVIKGMSVENVLETYVIAIQLKLQNLKKACKKFIYNRRGLVVFDEEMKNVEKDILLSILKDLISC